jgi:hypothetical protein
MAKKKPTPKSTKPKGLVQLIAQSGRSATKTQDIIAGMKALAAEIEAEQKRRGKSN